MLKRKNEESEESKESTHYVKRVALDADAVERKDMEEDKHKTSVSLNEEEDKNDDDDYSVDNVEPSANVSVDPSATVDEFSSIQNVSENSGSLPLTPTIAPSTTTPSSVPTKGDYPVENNNEFSNSSGPISSHRVQNDDPTYVHFRMLASISDTALIVGKGGESISKIKDQSNARVNASDNLKGVPERIISVRGPAEYVAKAFGLIVRTINNEQYGEASNMNSKSYNLRLLFPHSIMGYIIGKKGSRFREIEENSAAALKANEQLLPSSTDRVLNINGVADAIHIATYYVAQTVIEHKQQLQKAVYYNPANFNQPVLPALSNNRNNLSNNVSPMNPMNPMMSMYSNQLKPDQQNNNNMMMNMMQQQPIQSNPMAVANTRQGETITGLDGKVNQDLYVPQNHIGLVIGRGGKNLKDIRQNTGCYVKVNDEIPGAIERKLTLIGNIYSIQNAIILINNKIENEKQRQQQRQMN